MHKYGRVSFAIVVTAIVLVFACSSLPKSKHKKYMFPKAHVFRTVDPGYDYEVMGPVRAKVVWPSLDMEIDEKRLCQNYYNQAAHDLLKFAKKAGGEDVIEMRSVVFLMDERVEFHDSPECSDDGEEGEILTQGIAVRRKQLHPSPSPSSSSSSSPRPSQSIRPTDLRRQFKQQPQDQPAEFDPELDQ